MNWIPMLTALLCTTFTGWLVAWMATWILFRPLKPVSLFGRSLQGVFPRQQQLLATTAGEIAAKEFLSFDAIEKKITDPATFETLKPEMERHIDIFLREKLKSSFPMISMFVGDKTINQLKTAFLSEVEELFPVMMMNYMTQLKHDVNVSALVSNKIMTLSPQSAEAIFLKTAGKEIRAFRLSGALLGCFIGLIQVGILLLLR